MNRFLLPIVIFLTIAAIFHFVSSNFADLDSFYYMGLANLFKERGLLNVDFPWIYHSVIRELGVSLWYGFGIFLIPFSYIGGGILGLKIIGVLLTAAALFAFYWAVKRFQFRMPWLWPFLLFFAAANVTSQFLMIRPQTISLILTPLLFYFLVLGNFWGMAIASFGIAWFHMNLVWVPLVILGAVVLVRLIIEKRFEYKSVIGVAAGSLAGWLLRPNPFGALKLFYIQVVQQILEKQSGLPLLFGKENFPLSTTILFKNFSIFMILWIAAIVLVSWKAVSQKVIVWSSLILSAAFFALTIAVTRRAYNFWAIFGVLLIGAAASYLQERKIREIFLPAAVIAAAILVFYSGYKTSAALQGSGYPQNYMREAGLWLKDNSEQGDIVFNIHWPHFSPLFFWNQKNYYTGGLDPIFLYALDPSLYWKFHYLSGGVLTDKTCGAVECKQKILEDTHNVLKRDYGARYIVLNKDKNSAFYGFLDSDSRFEKKMETGNEAVYLIK
ncbi:MAG: hypothetical protein AAB646_02085 [Patescibacteria group bacterium]